MDLTLNRTLLLEELALLQGVLERRTPMPILADILLTAQGDRLTLAATDLDVTLIASCPAAVRREGRATIRGKVFFELVRSLTSDSLDLTVAEDRVEVRSGSFHSSLVSLRPEDFPTLPAVPSGQGFAISPEVLHQVIDHTFFAVSPEEGHFQFNAALLCFTADAVEMVATDGHRLALARHPLAGPLPPFSRQLLPRKVLGQLRRLPPAAQDPLYLAQGENHLAFRLGERVLLSRLLEQRFPQYERVITRDHPHRAVVPRAELLAALRRLVLLTSERVRGVLFEFGPNTLGLRSVNFDLGQASDSLPCTYAGPPLTPHLNANFLIDFLSVLSSPEVEIHLRDASAAVFLQPHGGPPAPLSALYVIMPIRV